MTFEEKVSQNSFEYQIDLLSGEKRMDRAIRVDRVVDLVRDEIFDVCKENGRGAHMEPIIIKLLERFNDK